MPKPDWQALILDPSWLKRLEQQAARRFVDAATAEEASAFVLEQLAADDWARCRRFEGHARPTTYLYSVAAHLLEEFSRQRYGRARPPRWLQQQGEIWVTLWRRICLERDLVPHAVERLCQDGRHQPQPLYNIVRAIKARLPWCGAGDLPVPEQYLADGSDVAADSTLEQNLEQEQARETLAVLSALLDDADEQLAELPFATLLRCREQLQLAAEDALILRLHFQEGMSGRAIAAALGVPKHRPGRQIQRALKQIRQVLEANDIDLEASLQTLEAGR